MASTIILLPASGSSTDAEFLAELTARLASWQPSSDLELIVVPASPDLAVRRDLWEPALDRALEKQRHGRAAVLVLHLQPHDWSGTAVSDLPAISAGRAVTDWPDRAQAWDDVVRCLRAVAARGFVANARAATTASMPSGTTDRRHRNRLPPGVQATRSSPSAPSPFHAPQPPDSLFGSRDEMLVAIATALAMPSRREDETPIVVLEGPPGAGKSALAAAYAHKHRDAYPGGVFWCNVAEEGWSESIAEQLSALQAPDAHRAFIEGSDFSLGLAERSGWLLVLDGDSDENRTDIAHHLYRLQRCKRAAVLVTSSTRLHMSDAINISVEPLNEVEGAALLAADAGRAGLKDPVEIAAARSISRELGGCLGAIAMAGIHLARRPGVSLAAYAELLGREVDAIEQAPAAMYRSSKVTVGQHAAFTLSWGALSLSAQGVFRLLLALHSPVSRHYLAALARLEQAGLSDALNQLDAGGFLDDGAGRRSPCASRRAAWLAGDALEAASFARECALRELERLLDPLTLEKKARELSLERLLLDLEAMRQLWGRRAPRQIDAWLERLRAQSQALSSWDREREPDRLLVQLRDAAFEAGDDGAVVRLEEVLKSSGRPWLRRRNESCLGSGRLLGMHEGAVTALALSEDGRLAISGSEDGAAMCWDLDRRGLSAELREHTGAVRKIALAASNRLAVTASDDGTLKVWDLPAGTERFTLRWHLAGVYSVIIAPDGRTAESHAHDGYACVWDLSTGFPLRAWAASGRVIEAAPSTDDLEVKANAMHDLVVRDRANGEVQRVLRGHTGKVLCTALHSRGRLVSGGADWTVRVWDVSRGALFVPGDQMPGNRVQLTTIAPGGRLAISASLDGTLAIWEVSTGRLTRAWQSGQKGILALAALSEERLVSASREGIQIWDLETGKQAGWIAAPSDILALGVAPGGKRAAALAAGAVQDGRPVSRLLLWDIDAGTLFREVQVEVRTSLPRVTFANHDQVMITAEGSATVLCVLFASGEITRPFERLGRVTGVLVAAPEAGTLFCSVEGELVVVDSSTGEVLQSLSSVPSRRAQLGSVTPDGRSLALIAAIGGASDSTGRTPRLGRRRQEELKTRSGQELLVIDVPAGRVIGRLALGFSANCCSISPDGRTVLLGGGCEVQRRVIKKVRERGTGGWFDEVRQWEGRVYFVDREGCEALSSPGGLIHSMN